MGTSGASVAFAAAAVVSLGTSWVLVTRLERIGERLGASEALLGLIAALAANTPEITSSVTALAHHQRDVGAGVVIGSNVFNLAALLGLGAIVAGRIDAAPAGRRPRGGRRDLDGRRLPRGRSPARRPAGGRPPWLQHRVRPLRGGARRCPASAATHSRSPRRWTGWLSAAVDEEERELDEAFRPPRGRRVDVVVAVAALLVVVVAASVVMERTATTLGAHLSIPPIVVGGVVLAAVTSLPERRRRHLPRGEGTRRRDAQHRAQQQLAQRRRSGCSSPRSCSASPRRRAPRPRRAAGTWG